MTWQMQVTKNEGLVFFLFMLDMANELWDVFLGGGGGREGCFLFVSDV